MKIYYITNARLPTEKAHGYQIAKMCEALALAGVTVKLVHPTRINPIKGDFFDYYGVKKIFDRQVINTPDTITWGFLGRLGFYIQNMFFLGRLFFLRLDKDTVIYTRTPAVAWLFAVRGFQTVHEAHSIPAHFKWWHRRLMRGITKIVTVTTKIKDEYIALGVPANHLFVAPDAVDIKRFDLAITKDEARKNLNLQSGIYLGFFGRFRTMGMEKGLGDILYALKLLPPEFQLLAVGGSDEDINFYQNQARELGVSSRVIWSGYLERAEVALMQKACDILLMNFPDHIHYRHYMSPLKMFEYMASCRPIISTDLPSVREILNEANTCFIPTESPTALAQVAQKIVSDRLWAEGLASQALVDVREHTWDKRCRRIIDFINRE